LKIAQNGWPENRRNQDRSKRRQLKEDGCQRERAILENLAGADRTEVARGDGKKSD